MQDAFLRLWERWDQLRLDDASAYLFRTAMNVFRNRYRRTAHSLRKTLAIAPSDDAFETVDDRDLVVRTLRDLTADQRAVLLTGYVGLTSEEAGQMLGMRPSTVRTLATRARAAIRERVGEDLTTDERQVFERVMRGFVPPDDSLERLCRRDRKRRNQRIAAGVVGIAAFVAAVWIATSGVVGPQREVSCPRRHGTVQTGPVETGPTETRPVAETGPTETGPWSPHQYLLWLQERRTLCDRGGAATLPSRNSHSRTWGDGSAVRTPSEPGGAHLAHRDPSRRGHHGSQLCSGLRRHQGRGRQR